MPQLRQNIITGEWVVIAPERSKRPSDFISASQVAPASSDSCVFCVEHENYKKNRLKHFETDEIYVIPNKYPAFIEDPALCSPRTYKVEDGFFSAKPAVGGHDVVIIKNHTQSLPTFTREIWRDLFFIFRERYRYYEKTCNSEAIMAIYNQGAQAGASILHPHAQLFASSITPNLVKRELEQTERYWNENGHSAFDDLVKHEKEFGHRVLHENNHYLAFTQFAAKHPFETWIVPKDQRSHFSQTTNRELAAIVPVLRDVMHKLNTTLNNPPLNFFIHSAPTSLSNSAYYRWHIEIAPRISTFGGYELGSGIIIDTISPEIAAEYLNKKREID
jgi:UDPglucose--hexose-1-phosphate uridylyltransferase